MARATFRKGAKVARIEKKLDDPSAALNIIGMLMVEESQTAFKEQRFGGKEWEARAPINVFGLIADFHASGTPKPRRFESRPVLQDTGALANSIAHKVVGKVVEVGSSLPYAGVQNFGGKTESMVIDGTVRSRLWEWLKGKGRPWRKDLGWLLNKKFKDKKLTQKVQARKFVGITPQTRAFVKQAVGVHIMEVE